ncbi:MAG: hypothetical protein EOP48_32365 [Sphingobacteriales bacterium]|nr:MAG: hypothetical protein EOP48_32365 [Sphingobacteriales bacterium]
MIKTLYTFANPTPFQKGKSMKALLKFFTAVSFCVASLAAQAGALLTDPPAILIPAKVTQERANNEIKRALINRGWTLTKEESGKLYATLHLRTHVANILITQTSDKVITTYVSSENLDYKLKKDGKATIHKNYLSWINNLNGDISKNLQFASLDDPK